MKQINIGIVGCGNISSVYIENLQNMFPNTNVLAVSDIDPKKAKEYAEKFNLKKALSYEDMLKDQELDLIINLTTPQSHYSLTKRALLAGKNAYLEKPLALTYLEAQELVDIASEQHLLLGCAPDTFMGAGYQTARKVIDDGLIGDVLSGSTFDVCHGHENWHPSPAFFYQKGGGPIYDRGPYNLTHLVMLLGSVKTVAGMTSKGFEQRTITSKPLFGQKIDVEIPTHVSGLMQFEQGAQVIITMSFDVYGSALPHTELHGTLGSLILPDNNSFTGDILYKPYFSDHFEKIPHTHIYDKNCRGIGVCDMANAIIQGKTPRTDAKMACHIVEIMEKMHISWNKQKYMNLISRCDRPEPLPLGLIWGKTE